MCSVLPAAKLNWLPEKTCSRPPLTVTSPFALSVPVTALQQLPTFTIPVLLIVSPPGAGGQRTATLQDTYVDRGRAVSIGPEFDGLI